MGHQNSKPLLNDESKHHSGSSSSSTSSSKSRTKHNKNQAVTKKIEPITESKSTEVVPYQGPLLGEAWPEGIEHGKNEKVFTHKQVGGIILDYLGGDIDGNDKRYTSAHLTQFTLFGISGLSLVAPRQATEFMLSLDFDKAEALVAQNLSILTCKIAEVKDRHGRTLINTTPFRATAAAGAFNPREMKAGEKNYGLVERFAERLSQAEVINQLSAQFPLGWEEATANRMKPYSDAVTEFGEAIINTPIPAGSTAAIACKPIVERYLAALKVIASNEVISIGLIFDLTPPLAAREYYANNFARFVTWDKRDLFLVIGYGSLLAKAASGDEPIIQHGIYQVMIEGKLPCGLVKFSPDMGVSLFIDDLGGLSCGVRLV
jgi:hypothetical protein